VARKFIHDRYADLYLGSKRDDFGWCGPRRLNTSSWCGLVTCSSWSTDYSLLGEYRARIESRPGDNDRISSSFTAAIAPTRRLLPSTRYRVSFIDQTSTLTARTILFDCDFASEPGRPCSARSTKDTGHSGY
jgi:hypothetical protein